MKTIYFHNIDYNSMTFSMNMIYNANCIELMNSMPESLIDLVVTSPPYDDLRNYD
jgi:site-specific DNA-methyltransferase (adenine-specific)